MNALDDPTERRAAILSFERPVDTMNVALCPVLHWLNGLREPVEEIDERPEWPPEEVIMSVSSEEAIAKLREAAIKNDRPAINTPRHIITPNGQQIELPPIASLKPEEAQQ